MVYSSILSDFLELQRYSKILASLTSKPGGPRKYSSAFVADRGQLFLFKDGYPILGYGIVHGVGSLPSAKGLELIEEFIRNFEDFKHLSILYDDPILARRIEFQYANVGLQKGERCLYVIPDDSDESSESIREQMDRFGIDTVHYMTNERLNFVRFPDPAKDSGGLVLGLTKIGESLRLPHSKIPFRLVSQHTRKYPPESEFLLESGAAHFPGSLLCGHYIANYAAIPHGSWIRDILRTHDANLIVCSENGTSLVLPNDSFDSTSTILVTKDEETISQVALQIQNLPVDELERDLSEIRNDISFLVMQVRIDLGEYSPLDLQKAVAKISLFKRKEEMMTDEYNKRSENS